MFGPPPGTRVYLPAVTDIRKGFAALAAGPPGRVGSGRGRAGRKLTNGTFLPGAALGRVPVRVFGSSFRFGCHFGSLATAIVGVSLQTEVRAGRAPPTGQAGILGAQRVRMGLVGARRGSR
jgi:hypothetical protein